MKSQSRKSTITCILLFPVFIFISCIPAEGQVKITDGSVITMNPNSLLELESSDKGLLIPRITINNLLLPSPLTEPIPAGMLVFSTGGTVTDGFYYWDGTSWNNMTGAGATATQFFTKSADDTLTKANSIIFASNDITLTLPQVTSADTGLQVTVKNVGSHIQLVTVTGYESATIDNLDSVEIYPNLSKTFVARGEGWVLIGRNADSDDILDVGPDEPFQSISDALDFLKVHMHGPKVLRVGGETVSIDHTETIDLPYPLTIQGSTFGTGTIAAGPGLAGTPMFRCLSESYFKMLIFDATTLAGYGTSANEDAVRLVGDGTYNEIKDCTFDRFYNTIVDSTDAELWLFECDISNSQSSGLLLHSALPGAKVRVSETDFIHCNIGVNLSKGSFVDFQLMSAVFDNKIASTSILYNPPEFSFLSMIITNISSNHFGNGMVGFDFSRADGRDANAFIENNPGFHTSKPHCKINVVNNTKSTYCTTANHWYKTDWVNTSTVTTNIAIDNNKITYLPGISRDIALIISGNVMTSSNNRIITVGIVKNGDTSIRYGETTLRVTVANQPFQFSTVIYLEDVEQGDYFELFCSSANSLDVLKFQDINWYVTTQ